MSGSRQYAVFISEQPPVYSCGALRWNPTATSVVGRSVDLCGRLARCGLHASFHCVDSNSRSSSSSGGGDASWQPHDRTHNATLDPHADYSDVTESVSCLFGSFRLRFRTGAFVTGGQLKEKKQLDFWSELRGWIGLIGGRVTVYFASVAVPSQSRREWISRLTKNTRTTNVSVLVSERGRSTTIWREGGRSCGVVSRPASVCWLQWPQRALPATCTDCIAGVCAWLI